MKTLGKTFDPKRPYTPTHLHTPIFSCFEASLHQGFHSSAAHPTMAKRARTGQRNKASRSMSRCTHQTNLKARFQNSAGGQLPSHLPHLLPSHLQDCVVTLRSTTPCPNSSNDPCVPSHQTLMKFSPPSSRSGLTPRMPAQEALKCEECVNSGWKELEGFCGRHHQLSQTQTRTRRLVTRPPRQRTQSFHSTTTRRSGKKTTMATGHWLLCVQG